MKLGVALLAVLGAGIASAEPHSWMKKPNPNELMAFLPDLSGCPGSIESYRATVEGVLTRSRIKKLDLVDDADGYFYLFVSMTCYRVPEIESYAFTVGVYYGRIIDDAEMLYRHGYSGVGIGTERDIDSVVRGSVENAITDYLKANFDL